MQAIGAIATLFPDTHYTSKAEYAIDGDKREKYYKDWPPLKHLIQTVEKMDADDRSFFKRGCEKLHAVLQVDLRRDKKPFPFTNILKACEALLVSFMTPTEDVSDEERQVVKCEWEAFEIKGEKLENLWQKMRPFWRNSDGVLRESWTSPQHLNGVIKGRRGS